SPLATVGLMPVKLAGQAGIEPDESSVFQGRGSPTPLSLPTKKRGGLNGRPFLFQAVFLGLGASRASTPRVSPARFPPTLVVGISPRRAAAYEDCRPRPSSLRPSSGTLSVKGTSVDFLLMFNWLRFVPFQIPFGLDCVKIFIYICNAINQVRHGKKTKAWAATRCGKDGNAFGQNFRRGATAVRSGGAKSQAQVIP